MSTDKTLALVLAESAHLGYRVGWQKQAATELRRIPGLELERDAALAASRHESDLAQQALDSLRAMTAERDELQAQLKAAQADARRYRWARGHACTVQANSIGPIYRIDVQITAGARSLSSSIDAAMSGKEQA